jgi:hypothetical protein
VILREAVANSLSNTSLLGGWPFGRQCSLTVFSARARSDRQIQVVKRSRCRLSADGERRQSDAVQEVTTAESGVGVHTPRSTNPLSSRKRCWLALRSSSDQQTPDSTSRAVSASDPAVISEIDGIVKDGGVVKGQRKMISVHELQPGMTGTATITTTTTVKRCM